MFEVVGVLCRAGWTIVCPWSRNTAVGIPCGGSNASSNPRIRLLQVFAVRNHRCNESEGLANSRNVGSGSEPEQEAALCAP